MAMSKKLESILSKQSEQIDNALSQLFSSLPDFDMYQHLAYFMGFADETFKPKKIYGGKRFRSSLTMLLGEYYGVSEKTLTAALSIELFHNFTLIHDDIVDGDELRRGRPTVWKLVGTDHAINSGDAQMLMSLQTVLNDDHLTAKERNLTQTFLSQQYLKVIEGQFLDFTLTNQPLGSEGVSEEKYLEMVKRKTADLIAAATGVVGVVAALDESEQRDLFQYGYLLGTAYQLCDDVVSIWGSKNQTGKQEYGDLLAKKKTLPVLKFQEKLSKEHSDIFCANFNRSKELLVEEVEEIVAQFDSLGIYELMMSTVNQIAKEAKQSVDNLSLAETQKHTLKKVVDELLIDIKNV